MSIEVSKCVDMILAGKPSSELKSYYIQSCNNLGVDVAAGTVLSAFALDDSLEYNGQLIKYKANSGNGEQRAVYETAYNNAKKMLGRKLSLTATIDSLLKAFSTGEVSDPTKIFEGSPLFLLRDFNKSVGIDGATVQHPFIYKIIEISKEYENRMKQEDTHFKMNPVSSLLACSYVAQALAVNNHDLLVSSHTKTDSDIAEEYKPKIGEAKKLDMYLESFISFLITEKMVKTTRQQGQLGLTSKVREDAIAVARKAMLDFAMIKGIREIENIPQKIANLHKIKAHLLNRPGFEANYYAGVDPKSQNRLVYVEEGNFNYLFNAEDCNWVGKDKSVVTLLQSSSTSKQYAYSALKRIQHEICEVSDTKEVADFNADGKLKDNFASREKVLKFCLDTLLYCKALEDDSNRDLFAQITNAMIQPLTVAMDSMVNKEELQKLIDQRVQYVEHALQKSDITYKFQAVAPKKPLFTPKSFEELTDEEKIKQENKELAKYRKAIAEGVADGLIKYASAPSRPNRDKLLLASGQIRALIGLGMFKVTQPTKKSKKIIEAIVSENPFGEEIEVISEVECFEKKTKRELAEEVADALNLFIDRANKITSEEQE